MNNTKRLKTKNNRITRKRKNTTPFPIDVVYTWKGENKSNNIRYGYNNEIKYSLRSIEAYAPWVAKPLCGPLAELPQSSIDLLSQSVPLDAAWQSMVAIGLPLENHPPAVLLLASHDATRFTVDMGAFYLQQIAQLTAAALDRVGAYEAPLG